MTLERNTRPESVPITHRKMTSVAVSSATDLLQHQRRDQPINSRNSPSTLNVLTSSSDFEFGNSMLQLEHDLDQLSLTEQSTSTATTPSPVAVRSAPVSPSHNPTGSVNLGYTPGSQRGFFEGLLGCLRPVWTIIGKAAAAELKQQDDWEIPFESITDLQWLGSGAQGAVFLGKLHGEEVAVKKVRDVKETDIRNLRKLNHPNIISFKGVCTQAPCYCIIMEYCPYGQLYEILRDGKNIPPSLTLEWSKQIASGMNYLHNHKIIHRDLKSPNVLIGKNDLVKISDFGNSRTWNEKSTKMSFAGTVAWMAPEVIKNELCSEKVDIWSFGVVLWELLTGEVPYNDVDSSAIIWGVGRNSLHLPIPSSCPDGFKLLMKQCWSIKPRNRPSFRQILMHLEIASPELLTLHNDDFVREQVKWKEEIRDKLQKIRHEGTHIPQSEEELIKRRLEELRHAQDVREHYERKLERANNLYMELTACMLQLEKRERELIKREQQLAMYAKKRKSIIRPVIRQEVRLDRLSKKRAHVSGSEPNSPDALNNAENRVTSPEHVHPSPTKIRVRKIRHRRSNSKGSISTSSNSPVKSPTKDALHDELQSKQINLRHVDRSTVSPETFSYLGPGTAIRDWSADRVNSHCEKHHPEGATKEYKNLNDVCFGCDGECTDNTCSSKRSSKASADIESNACDSPLDSPSRNIQNIVEIRNNENQSRSKTLLEKDSNENLNCSLTTDIQTEYIKELTKEDNTIIKEPSIKRTISDMSITTESSPSPPILEISENIEMKPDNFVRAKKNGVHHRDSKHSEDSWSEEEGEVTEDEQLRNQSRQSFCSTLSSEEENTSEHSMHHTTDGLLSTNSSENLQLELAKCSFPDSSNNELKFRRIQHRISNSPDKKFEQTHSETSSDSDGCSDITVSTTVHRTRSLENSAAW
ncbi:hypothetical protein CHS0354_032712 [Potamilus streckersoni]|uniref:Mitogen-activated protein kinase kinase kinase n=1 Tax=Potamilus streckersoni TaxID=2493646 RepID=A0AAE0RR78_9BIVA|nr:hypothetical protein CHS0354_032712 [Potamilus streckersoni]